MEERLSKLVVECDQLIEAPAEIIWRIVRSQRGVMMPAEIIETIPPAEAPGSERILPLDGVMMHQRVMEIDDPLMMLRTEMTEGQNLPWSSYQSRIRIEPLGSQQARVTVTCLAAPTANPRVVERTLNGLIRLSLQNLKELAQVPDLEGPAEEE